MVEPSMLRSSLKTSPQIFLGLPEAPLPSTFMFMFIYPDLLLHPHHIAIPSHSSSMHFVTNTFSDQPLHHFCTRCSVNISKSPYSYQLHLVLHVSSSLTVQISLPYSHRTFHTSCMYFSRQAYQKKL